MTLMRDLTKNMVFVTMFILLVSLFYHNVYSKTGFLMKQALLTEIESADDRLQSVRGKRLVQEHEVSLLKTDNLDIDLLEEQARLLFNVKAKDEFQISE